MLTLEPMTKVRIIASKSHTKAVVEALYGFGAVQVNRSKTFEQDKPLPVFEDVSRELVKLRAAEEVLGLKEAKKKAAAKQTLSQALRESRQIRLEEFQQARQELNELRQKRNGLEARLKELKPFEGLESRQLESPLLEFSYVVPKTSANDLRAALLKSRVACEVLPVKTKEREYALVAFDKNKREKALPVIDEASSEVIPIPVLPQGKGFKQAVRETLEELEATEKALKQKQGKLEGLRKKHGQPITALRAFFEKELKRAELPTRFGATENLVATEGWVAKSKLAGLKQAVDETTNNAAVVEELRVDETPPSELHNPRLIRPFEFMVRFFSLPNVRELDPTLFIAITFPVFFGMILGDIGYGLCALALAGLLRAKFKKGFFRDASGMMFLSGLSTVFFGFIYAEFFGFDNVFGYQLHAVIHRVGAHGTEFLIALTVLVGLLHLSLGFLIGAVTALRQGDRHHAAAKLAWLVVAVGFTSFFAASSDITFFALMKGFASLLPPMAWLGLGAIGIAALLKTEGVIALMELPGLFANMFSYLRIMALGLAAVVFALIVDSIPLNISSFDVGSLASFAAFALLFVLGHLLALVLGLFESSIQSLRLHYVEFFSKFYKGGGIPFVPLEKEIEV